MNGRAKRYPKTGGAKKGSVKTQTLAVKGAIRNVFYHLFGGEEHLKKIAADEGGQAETKKRDQAFSKIDKLHRQKRGAQERVQRDNADRTPHRARQQELLITGHYRRLEHPFDNEPQRYADRYPAFDDVFRHRSAV